MAGDLAHADDYYLKDGRATSEVSLIRLADHVWSIREWITMSGVQRH